MLLRIPNILKISAMLILIVSLLVACSESRNNNPGGSSNGENQESAPQISLNFSGQELREVVTEVIPQINCGGTDAVTNQVEKSYTVEHTMEVGGGFEVSANGQVGIAGTGVELGTSVASNLGYGYGVSETLAKSITVAAAAGKDMQHTISMKEIWALGNAQITVGNQQYNIPFRFRKDFQLTLESSTIMKDCTSANLSPLEKMAGEYTLASWNKMIRPIDFDGKVIEGSLTIDEFGLADWKVLLEQTFVVHDPGRVEMTARGQVEINAMLLQGVPGGEFNNTYYPDLKWEQVSTDTVLAVRGWDYGSPNDPFHLSLDEQSSGRTILQMQNSYGTFYWEKNPH